MVKFLGVLLHLALLNVHDSGQVRLPAMVVIVSVTRNSLGNIHTITMSSDSSAFTMKFTANPRVKLRIGMVRSNTTITFIQVTLTTLRATPSLPPSCQYYPMPTLKFPATSCTFYKLTQSQASHFLLSLASNLS